jgi:hypothetical protein
MTPADAIAAVERRAFAARRTMRQVCAAADPPVHNQAWSRAKTAGRISVRLLTRMEAAVARLEQEKSA